MAEEEEQFSGNHLHERSDVIAAIQRHTVTVMEEVVNWLLHEQHKSRGPIADANFTVVLNRVSHSVISSNGWMTTALVEADLLKALEKDSVEEDRIEMRVLEGEDVVVGTLVIHHLVMQGERENAEIAAKKVIPPRIIFFILLFRNLIFQYLIAGHTRNHCLDLA